MPPRVRPIEKFARAAAQCSAEVHSKRVLFLGDPLIDIFTGLNLRQMYRGGLQSCS
jgi:hypothetical protein